MARHTAMARTLLIGLGNPGDEYADTYHNAGREALLFFERLAGSAPAAPLERGKRFRFSTHGDTVFVYPDSFMNESGPAVAAAIEWFGAAPGDAVILHDDSDLAVGEYKEATGGAAGHHGVESILRTLGDVPLRRIRIGIRHPGEKTGERPRRKAGEFVLKKIASDDREKLETVFANLAERIL